MNLPERVKVGGFWYSIEPAHEEMRLRGLYGRIEHLELKIQVDETLPTVLLKHSLWHEIVHATEAVMPPEQELSELQLKVIARTLFQVFTENPEIRKFIFEDEE